MNDFAEIYTQLDLRLIKRGLLTASVFVFILVLFEWHLVLKDLSADHYESLPKAVIAERGIDPLSVYEAAFDKSKLFGTYSEKADIPVLRSSINELTKDYRLKGVVFIGEPEAILENARTNKSIFVKAGDKAGDLTVAKVGEGLIVLSYFGEEKELRVE